MEEGGGGGEERGGEGAEDMPDVAGPGAPLSHVAAISCSI